MRTALFQRKGGATPVSSNEMTEASAGSPGAAPDASAGQPHADNVAVPPDGGETCLCPSCGCEFDAATGEIVGGDYAMGGEMPAGDMPMGDIATAMTEDV